MFLSIFLYLAVNNYNLRNEDDTVILTESEQQLQRLINVMVAKGEEKGLHLNSAKSVSMVFSKLINAPTCHINVHGNILYQVEPLIYVGSLFSSDARCDRDWKANWYYEVKFHNHEYIINFNEH